MRKRDQFKRVIIFFEGFIILAIHTLLFAYIWYNIYAPQLETPFFRRGDWAVIGFYALIMFLITRLYGGFKIGYLRLMDVLFSQMLSLFSVNILAYLQLRLISRKYVLPGALLKMTLWQIVIILLWVLICKQLYALIYPSRRMLLIYDKKSPDDMIAKMHTRKDKYHICEVAHIRDGVEAICDCLMDYDAILIYDIPSHDRNIILKKCYINSIRTYVTPKISDVLLTGSDKIHLFDTPLLLSRNMGLSGEEIIWKRLMDLTICIPVAIVLMPIFLIIALCIKFCDGGPILYKQDRLTVDGKRFYIYKFRSMYMDSEKDGAQLAKKHDDRITPIGKFLRATHFDEFPQLINIIKGDMSLIGPRPERPIIAEEYKKTIPEFDFRLKVKAGLTGYAQIYGKYNTTPYDKLKLDLTYIENYSIWLDIKLLLLTVKVVFQKENTEGIDENQITAVKEDRR